MTSYSVYPDQIDAYGTLPLVRDGIDEIRARDHNSLRDAIIKIEQELGLQPSGAFATVRARLDDVADAKAQIEAHLVDPVDAHDASAISILDPSDNYIAVDVEGALGELAAVLPERPDVIGFDNPLIPNTGIPSFVGQAGRLHVYNTTTSGSPSILERTQPIEVSGVHIFDVGESNGEGLAELEFTTGPNALAWKGPGDIDFGDAVDISSLTKGELVTLTSPSGKSIRVSADSALLPFSAKVDTFELFKLDAATGNFSIGGDGIADTQYITRTAISRTNPNSRFQFMISGEFFPADRGTLVLQRKLRLAADDFTPIAILDVGALFDEARRESGQLAYIPTLAAFDTVSLFDVHPIRNDYDDLELDADGNPVYENYDVNVTFTPQQIGKYLIPVSNDHSLVTNAVLGAPADITVGEIEQEVSSYRIVHYISGVTDFNGEPDSDDIFSISDPFGGANDGDSNVRMSNVIVDTSETRPGFHAIPDAVVALAGLEISPVAPTESTTKVLSGIHYYNSENDLFNVEAESDTNLFSNTYLERNILRFETDVFTFPSGTNGSTGGNYGTQVDVLELEDTTFALYSDSNLPDHTTTGKNKAFYRITGSKNTDRRIYPDGYQFSTRARVTGTFWDPFGPGETLDAYGYPDGTGTPQVTRILVNSYQSSAHTSNPRADETKEWFTDEDFRVGTSEDFTTVPPAEDHFVGFPLDTFDSTTALGYGELQVGGRWDADEANLPGLIFPQDDYTSGGAYDEINPIQFGLVDYSDGYYEVESTYQRLFNLGWATNGGRLRIRSYGNSLIGFNDIDDENPDRPVKIEVKIPGSTTNSTGWLDIGKLYEINQYDDGDGALKGDVEGGPGDFTVPFTFGVRNTADANFMIAVRITYAPEDNNVETAKRKIMSYMELLPPVPPPAP